MSLGAKLAGLRHQPTRWSPLGGGVQLEPRVYYSVRDDESNAAQEVTLRLLKHRRKQWIGNFNY